MAFDQTYYMGYNQGSHRFANSRWERQGYFGGYEYSIAGSTVGVMAGSIFGRIVLAVVRYAASQAAAVSGIIYFTLSDYLLRSSLAWYVLSAHFPIVSKLVHGFFIYSFFFYYHSRNDLSSN